MRKAIVSAVATTLISFVCCFPGQTEETEWSFPKARTDVSIKDFVGRWSTDSERCYSPEVVLVVTEKELRAIDVTCDFITVQIAENGKSVIINATCISDEGALPTRWSFVMLEDDSAVMWIHDAGTQCYGATLPKTREI